MAHHYVIRRNWPFYLGIFDLPEGDAENQM